MRCNPLVRRLQQLVAAGAARQVRNVRADLGFVVDSRRPTGCSTLRSGGGALLDIGVYPLTFATCSWASRASSRRRRC